MRGFTLIEIMVVVVIIGLLAAIIGPNVIRSLGKAEVTRAEVDIKGLKAALGQFRMDHHRYPTEDEGLRILTGVAPPGSDIDEERLDRVVESLSKDPWNRDYLYRFPSEHGDFDFDVFSVGPDGEEGSDDDIGSWQVDE